ncbi:MAG: YHYH protein [Erythrobacter sp.]|nr:YHYH protein [Erythrobacter sp.]
MTKSRMMTPALVCAGGALALVTVAPHVMAQRSDNGRGGPPAEAVHACSGLQTNDTCSFATPHGELSGSCFAPGGRGGLACRPARHSAQGRPRSRGSGGPPPLRRHTVTQSSGAAVLVPATEQPIAQNIVTDELGQRWRELRANGIAAHLTGQFPNSGNPHRIEEQRYDYRVPAAPSLTGTTQSALGQVFGIAVNGVVFDPGANEFYRGDRGSGWQYEPLRNALDMGLDENHAHVQPNGAYHYHGLPSLLLDELEVRAGAHSPLIGWAADGFPIYALYGSGNDGEIREFASSYRVKPGTRPSGDGNPGGTYDGTFTKDYEYVAGLGDLDECNGRWAKTPDFPAGTYTYFLTRQWPVVPRCYKGSPSSDFVRRRR